VAGVVGANLSNTDILLTALSGALAGAISMAAGEYVATKTQRQVMDGEIILERKHIAHNRDSELGELNETFTIIGIDEHDSSDETNALRTQLLNYYRKRDGAHLKVHAVLEHGVVEKEKRSPWVAGTISFFVFIAGTLPSVIPFCATQDVNSAFTAAAVSATIGLMLVGAIKVRDEQSRQNDIYMPNDCLSITCPQPHFFFVSRLHFHSLENRV
jgi:vacuolar iron transporter family protein